MHGPELTVEQLDFSGAIVLPDFVSADEEHMLVDHLQQATWTLSQSGRMKLDYGLTKVNFKKKKVKH